jgi:excisionase family DNA binding protein
MPERSTLDDSFLTVAEVAEILKLNQQTVRNWIDQGSLPALRVGRRVRIRRSDLERLLEASSTAAGEAREEGPSAEDFWSGEAVGLAAPPEQGTVSLAAPPEHGTPGLSADRR